MTLFKPKSRMKPHRLETQQRPKPGLVPLLARRVFPRFHALLAACALVTPGLLSLDAATTTATATTAKLPASLAPKVEWQSPAPGSSYRVGTAIDLQAVATDPDGYASSLEFYDGDTKIGESNIAFIRQPDNGSPITHTAVWKEAAPGFHQITARARDNSGVLGVSAVLQVEVTGGIVPNTQEPSIRAIRIEKDQVLVQGSVPAGVLKVTLESRERVGAGAWQPRAIQRLDGKGGTVEFSLAKSAALEVLRLRTDTSEALPASFYQGTTQFNGQLSTANNTPTAGATDAVTGTAVPGASKLADPSGTFPGRSVVESDIWKIQDKTLYFFNQYRGLQVINLSNPDAPVVRSELEMPAVGEQMYVLENGTAVLLARDGCGYGAQETSQVVLVDTQGEAKVLARLTLPGSVQESRMVGNALYVASQQYRPITGAKDGSWEWGSVVSSFDLSNPAAPQARNTLWYTGYGNVITATDRFLFVAVRNTDWNGPSSVRCIDISNPDGTMMPVSVITPSGVVQDKFKINLNGDVLSIISERWEQLINGGVTVTKVETFNLAEPKQPQRLGTLEIGRGERLFATRFDADRVYVVTFLRKDPLWIVDLSNPAKPSITGELQVPGWSTYIHPLGDQLVTVGIDNVEGWRVAVSLFDVSDVRNPKLSAKVPLGDNYSWSEANADEKAFTVLPESGLILVPYQGYTTNGYASRVQIIDLNLQQRSLKARGVINQAMQPRRATEYGDRILSISGRELVSVDAANRDTPVIKASLTLSWNVNRLWVQGDYQVQVDEQTSWDGLNAPFLRVVKHNAPESLLSSAELSRGLRVLGGSQRNGKLYLAEGRAEQVEWQWFEKEQTSRPVKTNAAVFRLSIYDLTQLPKLALIGQVSTDQSDPGWGGDMTPSWIGNDVLVWLGRASYWGPWLRGGVAVDAVAGVGAVGKIALMPWWGGGSSGTLTAFRVTDAANPVYLSKASLTGDSTEGRWNFSTPIVDGNLIYSSYQVSTFLEGVLPPGQKPPEAQPVKQDDGSVLMVIPTFGSWTQRYYLSVVDYSDPSNPTTRKPVNIPGTLNGLSHGGAVLYTVGNHWDAKNNTDWSEWLDVLAYDGVQASQITTFQLPTNWPHPVLVNQGVIALGRPSDGNGSPASVETWALGENGRLGRLSSTIVPASVSNFLVFGNKVIGQSDALEVFDVSSPAKWSRLGSIRIPGCLGYDLTRATEDGGNGLWVPLSDYGIRYLNFSDLKP